ncbi:MULTISPECIES: hypothetical protein [Streptomyces]|uniref:hypothetical protein n=1 Tax=Streptomyces TaxID=1883 RepID=UPI001422449C|nr:hypothetical protein [Streptomyces sp. MBT27]
MKPNTEDRRFATDARIRAALLAGGALVTHADLRRDPPPQGRARGVRQVRGLALAALGVAAAVVVVCLLALLPGGPLEPAPVPPARTPGVDRAPSVPSSPSGPPRVIHTP